jgi:hypothetical protein
MLAGLQLKDEAIKQSHACVEAHDDALGGAVATDSGASAKQWRWLTRGSFADAWFLTYQYTVC